MYQLSYHPDVVRVDLPRINRNLQRRIQKAIEERLLRDPLRFGEPLHWSLKGYRKLRVGDYRVIYEVRQTLIRIFAIGHRKEIYDEQIRPWPFTPP